MADAMIDTVICGDCLEVMRGMNACSVDTIITDPPYGLKFMGKKWDYDVPSIETWKECLRVLKPGGTALIFAGSRTQHRMAVNVEDAGFILKDEIEYFFEPDVLAFYETLNYEQQQAFLSISGGFNLFWLYGSGFPKATDISKQLDKTVKRVKMFEPFATHYETQRQSKGLTHNRICEIGKFYHKHNHGGASSNWSMGANVPTIEQWKTLQPLLELSVAFLPLIERVEAEREIIEKRLGKITNISLPVGSDYERGEYNITVPATPEAILWNGWKSHGLKPAYEPILVAMKPNDGTYANNALKWGVSGLNIDGGRIGTETINVHHFEGDHAFDKGRGTKPYINHTGRFPANIILDEEAGRMLDEQSGNLKSGALKPYKENHQNASSYQFHRNKTFIQEANSGGASRFFYCAKASKKERNAGCEGMEEKMTGMSGGAQSRGEGYDAGQGIGLNRVTAKKNHHPTVKPLALMEYLCTLTKTPTGGIVLDPFCGSGTTCKAAKNVGRRYIGIEKDPDYCKIAEKRIQDERDKYALFGDQA